VGSTDAQLNGSRCAVGPVHALRTRPFAFPEKLLGYFCAKSLFRFIDGRIQSGDNLDRLEWTAQAFLHIAKAQSEATICRQFVRGSARNRAVLGNPDNRCTVCKACKSA
jgi:L-ribulose-5-phosphate 3-epimerase UlaE